MFTDDLIDDLIRWGYACSCRVKAKKKVGSATIIYSSNGNTYALTNYHVIESCIQYKDVWDNVLNRKVKKKFADPVEILFPILENSEVVGHSIIFADIVVCDVLQDIALLKFRSRAKYPTVRLYPRDKCKYIPFLSNLACIGAALGQPPIVTFGHLNGKQIKINNSEYWLSSALSIYGNSGGGVFLLENSRWYFIGISSRISIVPFGFLKNVVTHMGYFIPLHRIYNFLYNSFYQFIYDSSYTKEECEKEREEYMRLHGYLY